MKKLIIALLLLTTSLVSAKTVNLDLTGPVTEESMWILKFKLRYHINIGDVVYLNIDSPGGEVLAGQMFIAELIKLQKRGRIYCVAKDKVISMAMMVFINCDNRIGENPKARMLHHNPLFGYRGYLNVPIMEEFIRQLKELSDAADNKFLQVSKMEKNYMEFLRDTDTVLPASRMRVVAPCLFNLKKIRGVWRKRIGC